MKTVLAGFLAATLVIAAQGAERGRSPTGVDWVSGGVAQDEQQALLAQRRDYSFWLITAVRRSGAHLSGVRVRIREADSGLLVLDTRMDGPWLFARLPLGRYEVEATRQDLQLGRIEIERGTTTIHPNDHHQMLLYFDTGETMGESEPPVRKP